MTTELQAILNIVGVGLGVGAGWAAKHIAISRNGHKAMTAAEHKERCDLVITPITKRLETGDLQFEHIHTKLDRILELVYKYDKPWNGEERRKSQR